MSSREPFLTIDDPLLTTDNVTDDVQPVESADCGQDAHIEPVETVEAPKVAVNVRIDGDSCRLLRIAAAIDGCSQSEIVEGALKAYLKKYDLPLPYLPEKVLSAEKSRKTFYVGQEVYMDLTVRARMEVHSLDTVIYRAVLDRLALLPEAVL